MNEESVTYFGTVCWFNRAFGFITPSEPGPDIFCHYSDIAMEGYKTLTKGQSVSYQIGTNRRSQPKAINIIVIK